MSVRLVLVLGLLGLACGGAPDEPLRYSGGPDSNDGGADNQTQPQAGKGGSGAPQGGSTTAAGSGGTEAGSSAVGGSGGSQQATAGTGGATTGGQPGGASGGFSAGSSGSAAGTGGSLGEDPLKPKPAENCPGYVEILVPHGTCVWFHGSFTVQSTTCDVVGAPEQSCAVASAPSKDITGLVSDGVEFERFELAADGCPKKCGGQ